MLVYGFFYFAVFELVLIETCPGYSYNKFGFMADIERGKSKTEKKNRI